MNVFYIPQMISFLNWLPWDYSWTDIINSLKEKNNLSVTVSSTERITNSWALVIVANHPYSLLDQYSIASVLEEYRPMNKIKIITDNVPSGLEKIYPFAHNVWKTPEDKRTFRKEINEFLKNWWVLIVFPWAKVSHRNFFSWSTIEGRWRTGAIHFANYAQCPIIPVYVWAKTSFFYNLFSNFLPRSIMKYFNFREALSRKTSIHLVFWSPRKEKNLTINNLRDMVYKLWNEKYFISKK
jgi:hypothetical protein